MTAKTSLPGNRKNRPPREGGYVLFSLVIGVIIAGLTFATIAGSIALLVRNAAVLKSELAAGIEKRNALAAEQPAVFGKEQP